MSTLFPLTGGLIGGAMSKDLEIKWLTEPEEHNYPAALSYLSLLDDEKTAASCVERLKAATMSRFKAKDIFRA
jgi:hypothetical protein